jgi:hypothetical protein
MSSGSEPFRPRTGNATSAGPPMRIAHKPITSLTLSRASYKDAV